MTFLPLAERELRVAARQPITRRLRLGAALAAVVIASGFYLLLSLGLPGASRSGFGSGLFVTLIAIAFGAALLAGPFLTSDCLSEEKREGTLGFLFLTDLRGHDVVLGKLASTSVRAGFALLALLPVVAATLLLGGITGLQFWKSALTLISTLAVSLSAGMLASTLSRQPQKALGLTLLLLAILTGGMPLVDALLGWRGGSDPVFFRLLSPVYLLMSAQGGPRSSFWISWLAQLGVAAACLGASSLLLPHVWQDRIRRPDSRPVSGPRCAGRHRQRTRMLDENPAIWLALRDRWMLRMTWGMVGTLCTFTLGVGVWVLWFESKPAGAPRFASPAFLAWNWASGLLVWVLFIGAATHAVRFFVEARRSGLLELLLVTPLTDREIVSGHWRGWLRCYAVPVLLCLMLSAASSWAVQQQMFRQLATPVPIATPVPGGSTNAVPRVSTNGATLQIRTGVAVSVTATGVVGPGSSGMLEILGPVVLALFHLATTVLNLVAAGWVGMWMGLTSRGVTVAALKTFVFVQVIPWFVIAFLSAISLPLLFLPMLFGSAPAGAGPLLQNMLFWIPFVSAGVSMLLSLLKDVVLIVWAQNRLWSGFRLRALPTLAHVPRPAPPVLSAATIPPVMGS